MKGTIDEKSTSSVIVSFVRLYNAHDKKTLRYSKEPEKFLKNLLLTKTQEYGLSFSEYHFSNVPDEKNIPKFSVGNSSFFKSIMTPTALSRSQSESLANAPDKDLHILTYQLVGTQENITAWMTYVGEQIKRNPYKVVLLAYDSEIQKNSFESGVISTLKKSNGWNR